MFKFVKIYLNLFKYIKTKVLMFLSLTLNKFHTLFQCFNCWLWASIFLLLVTNVFFIWTFAYWVCLIFIWISAQNSMLEWWIRVATNHRKSKILSKTWKTWKLQMAPKTLSKSFYKLQINSGFKLNSPRLLVFSFEIQGNGN